VYRRRGRAPPASSGTWPANVLGVLGRVILQALVAGTTDPETLAELAKGRLREKRAALERTLSGRLGAH
jgi:transposase